MYRAERLPALLQQLGKDHNDRDEDTGDGGINDCILWQVASYFSPY